MGYARVGSNPAGDVMQSIYFFFPFPLSNYFMFVSDFEFVNFYITEIISNFTFFAKMKTKSKKVKFNFTFSEVAHLRMQLYS